MDNVIKAIKNIYDKMVDNSTRKAIEKDFPTWEESGREVTGSPFGTYFYKDREYQEHFREMGRYVNKIDVENLRKRYIIIHKKYNDESEYDLEQRLIARKKLQEFEEKCKKEHERRMTRKWILDNTFYFLTLPLQLIVENFPF